MTSTFRYGHYLCSCLCARHRASLSRKFALRISKYTSLSCAMDGNKYSFFSVYRRMYSKVNGKKFKDETWKDKFETMKAEKDKAAKCIIVQEYLDVFEEGNKLVMDDIGSLKSDEVSKRPTSAEGLGHQGSDAAGKSILKKPVMRRGNNSVRKPMLRIPKRTRFFKKTKSAAEASHGAKSVAGSSQGQAVEHETASEVQQDASPAVGVLSPHRRKIIESGEYKFQAVFPNDPQVHLVLKPMRGQLRIIQVLSRYLFSEVRITLPLVYVGMTEKFPLRPYVLIYGEHKSNAELREKRNLGDDVFIMGNSTCDVDKSSSFFPFATQYLMTLTKMFSPASILSSPFMHYISESPWMKRKSLVAFLSCRGECRERDDRVNFATLLSLKLQSHDLAGVSSLGTVCPEHTLNKRKWFLAEDSLLESSALSWFDRAVAVYSKFKFVIAFENYSKTEGYVTEKPLTAALSGAVVIYVGHASTHDYFNPRRVINLSGLGSVEDMVEKACTEIMKMNKSPPNFEADNLVTKDVFEWFTSPALKSHRTRFKAWLESVRK